ncbi:MAG: LysM peptidoglycan-binding domain-containing protein [Gammaproteobacteria bacterium]
MNSTSAHNAAQAGIRTRSGIRGWLTACLLAFAAFPLLAAETPVPRPAGLERDVQFWVRVYTEVTTNGGFLHDDRNLGVVYEKMQFAPNLSPREREKQVQAARDKYTAALRRIANTSGSGSLSDDDQRIKDMWGAEGNPARLLLAVDSIRFQLGQSDRFREGLVRSGAWASHIAEVFANQGLPAELAVLPHVESSFNPAAYSKVGAAGLWQFMRSTGRRYMRIDAAIDDRLDPFRSTEAAAQLLAYNYRLLGTWPLALTAYNHGAAGMRRARDSLGTDDIERIVRNYKSPTFGFASRNFYVSFLAALEIDRNPEKYFSNIEPLAEAKFTEITTPSFVPVSALERILKVDRSALRALNPALLAAVWNGQRHVPKGYRLRLPFDGQKWTSELLAQRLNPSEQYAGQTQERRHRVKQGETMASVAATYGVTAQALAQLNGIGHNAKLRAGRSLLVPSAPAVTVAAAAAAPQPPPVAEPTPETEAASVYVVRRGDSISEITKKTGLSAAQILKINGLKNPNYIYEGQKLALAPAGETPPPAAVVAAATPPPAAPVAPAPTRPTSVAPPPAKTAATPPRTKPIVIASATPPGGVPAEEAQRESDEDAEAVAKTGRPAARAEPVSAAQAEAIGPALGPAVETPQTADPIDYSVGKDDTIFVVAEETLGHYADWLGITAGRLRQVNNMKFGRPVIIGRKLKLDFSRTSREEFEHTRREFHRTLQASYFASHRIQGTEVYIVRRGDSLWTVTQKYARLPMWLLQQYNPDVDFGEMRAGTELTVPKVEEMTDAAG